jgi:DNA-directed RNA polymerase specialized sigma24 family protein
MAGVDSQDQKQCQALNRDAVDAKWHHYRNSADIDKSIRSAEIEALYRQHGAALLLFASAISGDRGRAQDAVHQVFLKAIENGSVSQAINKKAYLFACVRNAVLNDAKVQDRNMRLDVNSAWFSPPGRHYAGERNLRRALGKLPDDQREVIVLHVWPVVERTKFRKHPRPWRGFGVWRLSL